MSEIHECELMKEDDCFIMFEVSVQKFHIQRDSFRDKEQKKERMRSDIIFDIKYCPFCGVKL